MDVENRRRNLRWEKLAAVFAVICILTADRGISAQDGRGKPAGEKLELFDGKSKVIIVNGYSTSFRWPGGISGKTIGKGQLSYLLWAATSIRRVDGGYEFGSREAESLHIIDLCVIWMSFLRTWGDRDFIAGFDWLAKSQGT